MTAELAANPADAFLLSLGADHGESLFDALADVQFFVKDAHGRYVRANRTLLAAHGVAAAETILGRTDHDFIARHLADHYVRDDRDVLAGKSIWNRVELVLRQRGCPEWFVTTKIPLRSRRGKIVGLAGVSRHLKSSAATLAPFTRLAAALEHIRTHSPEHIDVATLAGLSHMSTRQFQRAFAAAFQMTPTEYLRQFRIGQAIEALISTNLSITSIALQAGFSDHSHFTREFVRQMKVTPGAYRKQYRQA